MENINTVIGPKVDRIESTPDMVWPSPEGRLNTIEGIVFNTVTFVDGEDILLTEKVEDNVAVTKPEDPVKEGYVFDDWYSDSELTTKYNFSSPVVADITIYAKFIEEYTVTFVDGDDILLTENVADNEAVTRPEDPVKEGYTFDNWYSDSELTTTYNFSSPVVADITIYAKFTED